MPDAAAVNRSLGAVRTELQFLADSGVLMPAQFNSIMAQLPQQGGAPSGYVDPQYGGAYNPGLVAQAAQDPAHPANPSNPKHHDWLKGMGSKLGNAAVFGAGATMGGDVVNSIFHSI